MREEATQTPCAFSACRAAARRVRPRGPVVRHTIPRSLRLQQSSQRAQRARGTSAHASELDTARVFFLGGEYMCALAPAENDVFLKNRTDPFGETLKCLALP